MYVFQSLHCNRLGSVLNFGEQLYDSVNYRLRISNSKGAVQPKIRIRQRRLSLTVRICLSNGASACEITVDSKIECKEELDRALDILASSSRMMYRTRLTMLPTTSAVRSSTIKLKSTTPTNLEVVQK